MIALHCSLESDMVCHSGEGRGGVVSVCGCVWVDDCVGVWVCSGWWLVCSMLVGEGLCATGMASCRWR